MGDGDRQIESLRNAVSAAPDNGPLRRIFAESLRAAGRFDEAKAEYTEALRLDPDDADSKIGLAELALQNNNVSLGLVLVEDVIGSGPASARARVVHAKLLLRSGRTADAVEAYKAALAQDPRVEDEELNSVLGMQASGEGAPADAEVHEGKLRATVEQIFDGRTDMLERPGFGFDGLGGMESVKDEVRMKIILPMSQPDLYAAYGKKAGGGMLLYGPPGCGKTHLARATAGEIEGTFLAVGLQDVLDMYIGQSERQLHDIFESARDNAPSVLFFDEVDALAAKRSDLRHSAGRHVINQFLSEFDGVNASNEGVLILAATNAPWHVDPAFRRPGRFDRVLFVPPPDEAARAAILEIHLRGKPVQDIDIAKIAAKTKEFSGADLMAVVDQAVEAKLAKAMKSGKPEPLDTGDLLKAARKHRATTREWFSAARNHALYSNQSGLYDDVLSYLNEKR